MRVSVGISPNFLPESLWTGENWNLFRARVFLRIECDRFQTEPDQILSKNARF
ncbi:hypothetical protein LEP1GSC052_3419 [Leptospira kmetyi serovar Malaysia str. Bejo-Iso9]|nr:hypothetical protein LEP1GSC052_3419 [Leptospira kmetyi serovar Malaysia str. Bejo-Iso9]